MGSRVKPGDLIGIPLDELGIAVALVLHVSRYFKGSMMIGIYDRLFEDWEQINTDSLSGDFIKTPNYTAVRLVTSGRWRKLENRPELLDTAEVPELRVANTVFYKDEALRQVPLEEFRQYTELRGQGGVFVENKIRRHFTRGSGPSRD